MAWLHLSCRPGSSVKLPRPPPHRGWARRERPMTLVRRVMSLAGFGALPATFTAGQARAAGVHPRQLYAWRDAQEILELSRGVFRRADAPPASYPDLLAVACRAPGAVVCLLSAASVHDLTDEIPRTVQIAVPRTPRPLGSPTRDPASLMRSPNGRGRGDLAGRAYLDLRGQPAAGGVRRRAAGESRTESLHRRPKCAPTQSSSRLVDGIRAGHRPRVGRLTLTDQKARSSNPFGRAPSCDSGIFTERAPGQRKRGGGLLHAYWVLRCTRCRRTRQASRAAVATASTISAVPRPRVFSTLA